ncbi:hypothetical protein [Stenotrophomonas geniculata]|uniref:hypothetical protein n=1 Tax=Stenotrophomonas geniculata TaxID=86188 RepID=UPI0039AF85BE
MRAVLLMGLVLLPGLVLAAPPTLPSAWLERQQAAGADEANAAGAKASTVPEAKERCRVTKEWKVGETVVQHRVCDDPPKKPAGKV